MFDSILEPFLSHGPAALQVLGGIIAVLVVISPLTKSDVDNKILDALRWVVAFGGKAVGFRPAVTGANAVRDQRTK